MREIRKWLESIGLGQYADAFEANDIDMDLLKQVDDQVLKDTGVASAGHRLRIEVSSSNFPRFDRNLNTGGNNYDEDKGVLAHNSIHHSLEYPSQVVVTVVKHAAGSASGGHP